MEEIAEVYSRSLFEVAKESGQLDTVRDEIGQVADALAASRDLQVFFFSPYFSTAEKAQALDRAITGASETTMNFLKLLIEKHRMPVLFRIRRRFDALWEAENKLLPVEVTSAVALDESTVRQIGDTIGAQTGKRIELTSHIDPDIIGGIVLRVGNAILDASIRHRLEQLRREVARAG